MPELTRFRTHGISIECPDCGASCDPARRTQDKAGWFRGSFDCPVCDDTMFEAVWFPSEGQYDITRQL